MGMQQPVEAALRSNVQTLIRQDRHDLARGKRGEVLLVAGVQNPLSLLLCQSVRHLAGAAFTAIQSVPITRELAPPTLQGAQPHPKQLGQFAGPGARFQALFQDL